MLNPSRQKQLDTNIKELLSNGGSNQDVIQYAKDFTDKFSEEPVKKKEPTISQSEPQKVSGTLDTKKVQAQKPSESFTLKSDNNQLNFADEIKKSQEAQAKERKELGIFSGYPGKEKNLYRINQGSWERKMPGQKDWAAISNEGSINSLNKTFGGDVKPLVLKGKYAGAVEDTFKAKEEALSKISGKLIGKEEGDVVAFIQAKFPDFQVRKEGTFTDEIKLIAPNKQTLTVSLDNFTDGDDSARALELKEWMRTNSNTELAKATTELDKAEGVRQGTRFAVPGDKEYVENSPYGQPLVSTVKQTILDEVGATNLIKEKEVKEKRAELAKAQAKSFDSIRADIASSNLSDEEVNAKLASLPHDNETAKRVNSYAKDVLNVAKLKGNKEKELEELVDDISSRIESGEITKEQYESEYKQVIEDKTKEVENAQDLLRKEAATVSSFSKSLNESVAKNYIIAQTKGTVGGGVASSFLKGLTYLPRLASGGAITAQDQKELVELVTGSGTTAEYMASEDRGDLTKALFSITESLGAMASVGGAGGIAGKLPFFAQGYLNMKDEFDEIPDMTETEKVLMSSLYGVGSAVLEKFGLDFAMGKTGVGKSITNSIMKSAFSSIPKNATKEMVEIAIANSAKKMMAQAGIKTLGGLVAEAATETTQSFFEAGIKESYDALKGVEYFNNKLDKEGNLINKTAWDITKDALYEGWLGALGGGLMSSVSQSTNVLKGIANKENTSLLIDIANSVDAEGTVLADLKAKLIAGEITEAEAKETFQSFRKITGHVKSIPDGLTRLEKAASFKLLVEKDNLTKQIAGKDKALVHTQIERVNAINEELKTISINNSKYATTEIKQESIPVESSINEYKGTSEGQQEVGITEGEQGKTTINEADNSNINQPSQEEEITAETPVVEQEAQVEYSPEDKTRLDEINKFLSQDINSLTDEEVNQSVELKIEKTEIENKYGLNDIELKHGTPHDFNKFETEKIGTGEGAQAFGYGLYFTENSKIAKGYADKLSKDKSGIVYTVKIKNGKTSNWLEWREPVDASQAVELSKVLKSRKDKYNEYLNSIDDEKSHTGSAENLFEDNFELDDYRPISNASLYNDLSDAFGQNEASKIMSEAGIDGVKYNTRQGKGSDFNYVVFNPESITITKKEEETAIEPPATQQQTVAEEVAPVKMESPKKRLERAKAVQPTTPKQMVSQFFLNKGKISRTIIEELFGKKGRKPTKGEIFARANLYDPNSTDKLDTIAHSIWENNGGIESQYDTQDIKEALMEIVLADYKFSSLADNLLSDGGAKVVAEEDQFWFDKAIETQMEEQQASPSNIEADKEFKASRTQEQEQELANDIEAFEKEYASKQESAPESEDKVLEWLDKAIKYTGSKGKLYDASLGIPIALSNAALKIVREAYVATKNLHQAIKAGYDHLKANGIDITELEYKDSFVNKMAVKTPAEIRKAYQQGKSEVRDELTPVIKELRAKARDKARDRKVVAETIKAMVGKGRISTKQAANLVKRFNSVNVNNPKTLSAFYEYAERIMDNASYAQDLSDAFSLRSKIIKSSKNKDNQPEVKSIARKFSKIKPNLIEDMAEYIAQAKNILGAVRVSRETGMRDAIDLALANDYIQKEIANQEKQVEESDDFDEFEKEILANDNAVVAAEKELEMRRTLDSRFEILSGVIEFMLGGTNPISGEDVEYTPKQRDIISRVLKMDLSKLSIQEAHRINEGLDNFIQNGIVSGLEFRVAFYEGRLGAEEVLNKKGISYRKMKHLFSGALGRGKAQQLASLGILTDSLFGGVNAALYIESRSGIAEFSEGANKTERQHNEVIDAYIKKFYKTNKARFDVKYVNGQAFNSAFNNYERGMLAFIKRSVHGSDAEKTAELNRRIGIIKKGIADLKVSGKYQGKKSNETEMAKIYEELFNKLELGKENITISEIESKVDPANAEAVNDWINIWGENYGNLAEVSASVYNTVLAEDPGYTPDMFSRLSNATTEVDPKEAERAGSFGSVISLDKLPTGVLIESTKPAVLNERFPNFDFDINNSRALRSAMLDVNTAGATQKMNGFLSSKDINKIIPDQKDRNLWVDRVKGYQKRTRSEAASNSESLDKINRTANLIATYGTVKTLGGITQVIKQTIPVWLSTNFNAGGFSYRENQSKNSSFTKWIDNLDMGISQRGLDASTTIDSINDKLDKSDFGNAKTIAKAFRKINEWPLKKFLVKGDVFIARAAFATYYKKKAGIPLTQKVDWKNHTLDIEAARYAMAMIDRQQNISESQKGGDLSTTKDARVKIGSKALLPFSGFVLNQKQRMNADMRTMLNRGAGTEAQLKAFASLAGMTAEAVSYYAISFGIKAGIIALIYKAMGEEEPEEDKEKRLKNAGLTGLSNFTKDMLSPLPILDGVVTMGLNKAGELVPVDTAAINKKVDEENKKRKAEYKFDMDDEEEKKFREKAIKAEAIKFTDYEKITPVDLGVISIGIDKAIEQYDLTKAGTSGEVEVVFNGNVTKKYLLPEDREVMKKVAAANAMYLIVGLPTEVNEISRVVKKMMTKKALTEAQHEKYQEFKKVYKKEPNGYQLDLIKTRSKKEITMDLIKALEQSGMSQKAKEDYVKNKLK